MIAEKSIKQQIRRLQSLPFAPSDPTLLRSAIDELERVIKRNCQTEAHLEAAIDSLIDHAQRFPPPAELYDAIQDTPNPDAKHGPMGCDVCKGSGWRSYQRHVRTAAGGYLADFADFCPCAKGQWMKAAEKAREMEKNAKKNRDAFGG